MADWFLTRMTRQSHGERMVSLTIGAGVNGCTHAKDEVGPLSHMIYLSVWINDL